MDMFQCIPETYPQNVSCFFHQRRFIRNPPPDHSLMICQNLPGISHDTTIYPANVNVYSLRTGKSPSLSSVNQQFAIENHHL